MNNNGTRFEFVRAPRSSRERVLIVPLASKPKPPMQLVAKVDDLCGGELAQLLDLDALGDEVGHLSASASAGPFRRVVLVSLGESEKLNIQKIRTAAAAAARWLITERHASASLWCDGLFATGQASALSDWVGGMHAAGFRFDELREPDAKRPAHCRVLLHSAEPDQVKSALPRIAEATVVAAAANYTRRLAHLPPNVIHPQSLAAEARALARSANLKFTLLDEARLRKRRMNGLLAVGCGAAHGPCLIRLDYRAAPRAKATTVLVGKAVTFDTGGYSIKPAENMDAMKFDKCGGCTVLGVMKALAELGLKCNVTGLIAAAENAISGRAYRPGDILTMMSGKTVEVTNTDAEGRLILADALTYAQRDCAPTTIIDLATLTGGVRVALGGAAAGLMSNNDDLAEQLEECGRVTHERMWRLPLWDDYRELIRGADADIKNSSGKRDAHAIVGGMFLREFIDDKTPWAHLDIAGVATQENTSNGLSKGATGFGVRLLVEFLTRGAI
ncbi:MAG: leucyl aminopeptidase [Phycisphaerae bacterium]